MTSSQALTGAKKHVLIVSVVIVSKSSEVTVQAYSYTRAGRTGSSRTTSVHICLRHTARPGPITACIRGPRTAHEGSRRCTVRLRETLPRSLPSKLDVDVDISEHIDHILAGRLLLEGRHVVGLDLGRQMQHEGAPQYVTPRASRTADSGGTSASSRGCRQQHARCCASSRPRVRPWALLARRTASGTAVPGRGPPQQRHSWIPHGRPRKTVVWEHALSHPSGVHVGPLGSHSEFALGPLGTAREVARECERPSGKFIITFKTHDFEAWRPKPLQFS